METKKIPSWLAILIIIVVLIIAVVVILSFQGQAPKEKEVVPVVPSEEMEKLGLPSEIFSYQGKITEILSDKIIFEATAQENYLEKDAFLTALITEETSFLRITVPKVPPKDIPEGEGLSLFKREEIDLSDLKVGDKITAVSNTNIKAKTEFPAVRIEIIE
ncbi:MAG: hypothetical protein QMC93_01455 [Patescibacteria group bacterium]|nr:hypothetical protein [Patescibacteria group bacterium]